MTHQKVQYDIHPQTLCPRRAGQLTRYHTWPRLRDQSVAEHSWQVVRIILALWPDAPAELLTFAMFHDVGEVVTGDVPYPLKAAEPEVGLAMNRLDARACAMMEQAFMTPPQPSQVPEVLGPGGLTHTFFKMCDVLEMFEWALHEGNLGNRYAALVAQRTWAHATRLRDKLAEAVGENDEDADLMSLVVRFDEYTRARIAYETDVSDGANPYE